MILRVAAFALVVCLAASSQVNEEAYTHGGGSMIAWETRTLISSQAYPCVSEGFYPHPTNCSRFYRCVDFTAEGTIFSRYLFECPTEQVFADNIDTCVFGVCPEKMPGSLDSVDAVSSVDGTVEAGSEGETSPEAETSPPAETIPEAETSPPAETIPEAETSPPAESSPSGTDKAPAPDSSDSSTDVDSTSSEGSSLPPVATNPPVEEPQTECTNTYAQHEKYCNIFRLCHNKNKLFSCYEGTAFSEAQQMCRLPKLDNNSDDTLCENKEIFVPSASIFRSEFSWEEVGVLPFLENPVYNANPYIFTNLGAETQEKQVIPETSMLFKSTLGTSELENRLMEKKSDNIQELFDNYSARSGDRRKKLEDRRQFLIDNRTKKQNKSGLKQRNPFSSFENINMDDYEIIAAFEEPSDMFAQGYNFKSALPTAYPQPGPNDVFVPIHLTNDQQFVPLVYPYTSQYPFAEGKSAGSKNPFLSSLRSPITTPQNTEYTLIPITLPSTQSFNPFRSTPSSPPTNNFPYTIIPITLPQNSFSPYGPLNAASLRTPSFSPLPYNSRFNFMPFSPTFGSPYQFGSPQFPSTSPSSIFNPYRFDYGTGSMSQFGNTKSISPLTVNPYEYFNLGSSEEIGNLFSSQENSVKSSSLNRKDLVNHKISKVPVGQYNKIPTFPSSSVEGFEARNDEGDLYHIIPITEEQIKTLAKSGVLDNAQVFPEELDYETIKNMKSGEVILTSIP